MPFYAPGRPFGATRKDFDPSYIVTALALYTVKSSLKIHTLFHTLAAELEL